MNPELANFLNIKEKLLLETKEERSETTLKYYELIEKEMLQNPVWDKSQKYLYSVYKYIQEHEYISDKQMEIVDRIYRHPENYDG